MTSLEEYHKNNLEPWFGLSGSVCCLDVLMWFLLTQPFLPSSLETGSMKDLSDDETSNEAEEVKGLPGWLGLQIGCSVLESP